MAGTPLRLIFLLLVLSLSTTSGAQLPVEGNGWRELVTENFVILSQVSSNRTERLAQELEVWRHAAGQIITGGDALPRAAVANHVYVFEDNEAYSHFVSGAEAGLFISTPRRNFLALVFGDTESLQHARHHYVHFLMRNFVDLRIPRWYEEGLAGYLTNLEVERDSVQLARMSAEGFAASVRLNREVSLQELLYDEEALASPRLIQIANLKSETFLHYLLHGHQEEGFPDRRAQLAEYLDLSLQGRGQRFAFDQAFDINTSQLDREYERYLQESRRPRGELEIVMPELPAAEEALAIADSTMQEYLGELALNAGNYDLALNFYAAVRDGAAPTPRSISGHADAVRMQAYPELRADLAPQYLRAVEMAPEAVDILLDYGEYLEVVIEDCSVDLTAARQQEMRDEMRTWFGRALALAPDNAEANLAMGQLYLLSGEDIQAGVEYQRRALALLPAESFIMEQAIRYAIVLGNHEEAERLINELSQPLHFFGEPDWVTDLRTRLASHQQGRIYDACADH
ncbi:MAG: hypothetical protein RLZZ385_205 [Pseudomonadota bacterium]|jgi:tetratricopeptide (TPR) repeat protein